MVSLIEQGQRENPRASTLKALARALNVTVDELLREEDKPGASAARRRRSLAHINCKREKERAGGRRTRPARGQRMVKRIKPHSRRRSCGSDTRAYIPAAGETP